MNQPHLIIAFGSQITGHARADSDTDVAVFGNHALSLSELSHLAQHIAKLLDVSEDHLDLVDLWDAPPLLQHEVATQGKLIEGEKNDFLRFRVLAWKRYQDTQRFRRARQAHLLKDTHEQ